MAHHLSAKKRIRQTKVRRKYNRYYAKTVRNAIRNFKSITDKSEAFEKMSSLVSSVDKLVKRGIIKKNKSSNIKSKLARKVNALQKATAEKEAQET